MVVVKLLSSPDGSLKEHSLRQLLFLPKFHLIPNLLLLSVFLPSSKYIIEVCSRCYISAKTKRSHLIWMLAFSINFNIRCWHRFVTSTSCRGRRKKVEEAFDSFNDHSISVAKIHGSRQPPVLFSPEYFRAPAPFPCQDYEITSASLHTASQGDVWPL